ncbi:MAG: SIR2 family protein [Thermoanaerobaculia bacterium]
MALREAAQLATLIPFVGAGASKLAGCPDWNEFADEALKVFVEHEKFSHAQLDQIMTLNPRAKLAIALALQGRHKIQIDFRKILHRTERTEHAIGCRFYSYLSKLGKTFVTTNYDEWLDDEIMPPPTDVDGKGGGSADVVPRARTVYYRPEDLTAAHLNRQDVVIHLHGSVKAPNGMILTTPHYVRHYANDRKTQENNVLTFLEDLFRDKTVLFIGYGLAELEILEYLIVKTRNNDDGLQPRHFLLQGFFSHEHELMVSMRTYYRECGIELVPFLKDRGGWGQLINVLEAWSRAVPVSAPLVSQQLKEMEYLLDG